MGNWTVYWVRSFVLSYTVWFHAQGSEAKKTWWSNLSPMAEICYITKAKYVIPQNLKHICCLFAEKWKLTWMEIKLSSSPRGGHLPRSEVCKEKKWESSYFMTCTIAVARKTISPIFSLPLPSRHLPDLDFPNIPHNRNIRIRGGGGEEICRFKQSISCGNVLKLKLCGFV